MEIAHIRAFLTAADSGSFSRAAEILEVAQPSLSNRILSLEREVGQVLFERLRRGVRLTDAGRSFLPYAERVIRALDEGEMALVGFREGTSGQLAIASAPAVGTYVLPEVLKAFCQASRGISVVVRTGHSDEVVEMVLQDEA